MTTLIDGSKKSVDERVTEVVHDLDPHKASVITAINAPAAAAATPFFRASFSSTRLTNEVE